jgi:tRNA-splicing ligase RtcB (3'-phosphate/5'-hydroxy nucleic acid ligase)
MLRIDGAERSYPTIPWRPCVGAPTASVTPSSRGGYDRRGAVEDKSDYGSHAIAGACNGFLTRVFAGFDSQVILQPFMDKENTMSDDTVWFEHPRWPETLIDRGGFYTKAPVAMWTKGVPVEEAAMKQLVNIANLPFIHDHIAVMPDVHFGMGATVGSVIATKGAIVPAAVGVDIGCGMAAVRLSGARAEHLPDSLAQIRSEIEHTVPAGFNSHETWGGHAVDDLNARLVPWLKERHPKITERRKNPVEEIIGSQFGTLGGGNHFIELCIDERHDLWVMLHSGSRGIGNAIGQYFISQAREEMQRLDIKLPDRDLAYFTEGTTGFLDYCRALNWAQDYAAANRMEMLRRIMIVLHRHLPPFRERDEAVSCHHNYVTVERHYGETVFVTRKGAVRAGLNELGIIPGSMGARSYIVRGKGNPESFCSCSHGAGRKMSRGEAKRTFTLEDHELATEGVECRKDQSVIDETPGAYKDIDAVMAAQSDLVDVVHTLKQVLCVKG